ncbi:MAG: hypothetical protein GXO03_02750 [Aquificae bacterium]|nr:hypothetical protein [Aquificota bacterium]
MSSFIGFDAVDALTYETKRGEETRCSFCSNYCVRTFIDLSVKGSKKRFIVAPCEKGTVETKEELRALLRKKSRLKDEFPNLVREANELLFSSYRPEVVLQGGLSALLNRKKRRTLREAVVGVPRVLNAYSLAPFFRTYFEALGVKKVVFSSYTSEELYRKGAKRGSIDPCYPSKVALAHVHELIYEKRVSVVFFPCVRTLPKEVENAEGHWACPTVTATPEVVKAAFTKERDEFAERGVKYLNPVLDFEDEELLSRQLFKAVGPLFGVTRKEHELALKQALGALKTYKEKLRRRGAELLEKLKREKRVGVVLLARPYHNDPGLNHGIPDEINDRGYAVLPVDALPRDEALLNELFKEELKSGRIKSPLEITDVWPKCYSENSSLKVWAARFVSKVPYLSAVELSSFRCGHDAPIYGLIEELLASTGRPFFTFHELDENRPAGSIKLRVETLDYFLKRYEEEVLR